MRHGLRRLLTLVAALVLAMGCAAPAALADTVIASGRCGGNLTWKILKVADDNYRMVITGSGAMYENFKCWNAICDAQDSDEDCYEINSLSLPNGLTSIPDDCFEDALNGVDVVIPGSVKTIGDWAFSWCNLNSVTLQEGVQSIGEAAFGVRRVPLSIVIPKSVTSIGEDAFSGHLLWVYKNTAGERYCKANEITNYHVIDESDASYNSALMALSNAVSTAMDVPWRYRVPVLEELPKLGLTVSQINALKSYVNGEKPTLKAAMSDNVMNEEEISGFISRFRTQMDAVGIGIATNVRFMNGYPGVELTMTVNGKQYKYNVFRTGFRWLYSYGDWQEQEDIDSITLNITNKTLQLGQSVTIKATVKPAGTNAKVDWSISPQGVLRIDAQTDDSITLCALRPGTVDIEPTNYYFDGYAFCTVRVPSLETSAAANGGVLPANIKTIGADSFANTKFKQLFIPKGAKSIESGAFSACGSLRYIQIPDSVSFIADDAFTGCSNLTVFCNSGSYAAKRLMGKSNITLMFLDKDFYWNYDDEED